MNKSCENCGASLTEEKKFCKACESKNATEQNKIKALGQNKVKEYAKNAFSSTISAHQSAGEITFPINSLPATDNLIQGGLISVLKDGFRHIVGGFKQTLRDKKRLITVIVLTVIWFIINLLTFLGIFPLPIRFLSWITMARGSLIGGTIGKGIVAALISQIIIDKGMFKSLKDGFRQLTTITKGNKNIYTFLLIGAGVALIINNFIIRSVLQDSMVSIACFLLSVKALNKNGYLNKIFKTIVVKKQNEKVPFLMQGFAIGFALFVVVSFLPGNMNGILAGVLLLIISSIIIAINKNKQEVGSK